MFLFWGPDDYSDGRSILAPHGPRMHLVLSSVVGFDGWINSTFTVATESYRYPILSIVSAMEP